MIKKILLSTLIVLLVVAGAFVFYVLLSWNKVYDIPYPELQVSSDSTVIARGKYLVHGPAHCSNCHVSSFEDMVSADQGIEVALKGGAPFPMGPLGTLHLPNLTPDPNTGTGRYTDGQLFRMMRHVVKPDGTASLSILMPFWNMADEDLVAVVSYLRSMEPVENQVQESEWSFMGKAIRVFATSFHPVENPTPPSYAPPMAATVERGEYLARYVANCVGCHTRRDPMTFEALSPEYSGGFEFEPFAEFHTAIGEDPELWTRSPNITPHPNSALSKFKTVEEWKTRFRQGRIIKISPMHWGPFSRLTDQDLEALYIYLNSLEPVENDITETVFKK